MARTPDRIHRLSVLVLPAVLFLAWTDTGAATHVVQFGGSFGFTYSPSSLNAAVGDTVKWEGSFSAHPLSSTVIPAGAATWHVATGSSFSYAIKTAGTYDYKCDLHSGLGMTGSFVAAASGVRPQQSVPFARAGHVRDGAMVMVGASGTLGIEVPQEGTIALSLVDLRGRQGPTISNLALEAGTHAVSQSRVARTDGLYLVRTEGRPMPRD